MRGSLTHPPQGNPSRFPCGVTPWIALCVLLNCAGWILSALHQLNRGGYAIVFLLTAIGVALFGKGRIASLLSSRRFLGKYKRRFQRTFPLAFLILAGMAIAGGFLYSPTNYDALSYRIPRVLHWLAEGRWHWIHTDFSRLNTRAAGFEWLAAPVILFTGSDQFIFLINAVSFLFLPGLVFSVFTRLGVRPRVAWHWMWIVPAGYCFLLQAGSLANDMFCEIFALAAVDFALRARKSKDGDAALWWSVLAAALLTGGKASNIPLLLPWVIAVFPPALRGIKKRPLLALIIAIAAALSSFFPNAILNKKYCGDWTGTILEGAKFKGKPFTCILGNSMLLPFSNLVPPVFPLAGFWNQHSDNLFSPALARRLHDCFEQGGAFFAAGEMEIEEDAGLGFGVTSLLLLSVISACVISSRRNAGSLPGNTSGQALDYLLLLSPCVSLLVFMSESGLSGGPRIITPYYALLMPLLLVQRSHARLVRSRGWKILAMLVVFILSGVLVIIQPARPLFPVNFLLSHIEKSKSGTPLIARARSVYSTYRDRANAFAPAVAVLPADANVLGLIAYDIPETSLWKPFGGRRIMHVTSSDTAGDIERRHIKYVLVSYDRVVEHFNQSFDQWLQSHRGVVLQKMSLNLKIKFGSTDWYLVEIDPEKAPVR